MNLELDLLFWALVLLLWKQQDSLLPEPPWLSSDQAKFPPASCCAPTLFDQWSELGCLTCLPLSGICYILLGILLQQQYPVNTVVFSIGVALWTLCYMMVRRQYSNLHQHLCVIILVAGNEQQKWLWWCFCCALSLSATTNLAPLNFLEHELDLFLRELKHLFYISRLLLHHQKPTL